MGQCFGSQFAEVIRESLDYLKEHVHGEAIREEKAQVFDYFVRCLDLFSCVCHLLANSNLSLDPLEER